jgi:hypothetical protein
MAESKFYFEHLKVHFLKVIYKFSYKVNPNSGGKFA